ncbi:MAG TPA: helix-turn-helix transcriptional regulator [Mycobacteriales bacterium]|nr:helix-turn-helix transcriptional regulator [Mycobacteriales bacterium]
MPAFRGALLRAQRESLGKSVEQLALDVGRSASAIHKYQSDAITPSSRTLGALAAALGCSVADFYDDSDRPDPVAAYDAHLRAVVDALPPLTDDQRRRLAVLLTDRPAS